MKKKWESLTLFVVVTSLICIISCTNRGMLFDLGHNSIRQIKQEAIEHELVMNRHLFMHESVIFELNKASLSDRAKDLLNRKIAWLNENNDVNIIINGHCDSLGDSKYNFSLGKKRAETVRLFMIEQGIDGSRMVINSYGEDDPVDCGQLEEELLKNRRVRLSIVG